MSRPGYLSALWRDVANLFTGNTCALCGHPLVDGERGLCLSCLLSLPTPNYHRLDPNPLMERLALPSAPIENAVALINYAKGNRYGRLIYRGKYEGETDILRALGRQLGHLLKADGLTANTDCILPMPMHWRKRLNRGYNQVDIIAKALSEVTSLPVSHNLRALSYHRSQATKSGAERRRATGDGYRVLSPSTLEGKHILLVDDIITTGTTILSAACALHRAVPSLRITVACVGATTRR